MFCFKGLSTSYRIPCAFFFTKQLSGQELHILTLQVISEVEKCGFIVIRIVSDNHKSNTTMMKHLSGGSLQPVTTHPCDGNRKLFLSFDQCHILKNIRTQFLEREMSDGTGTISGKYVKLLHKLQKDDTVKPVTYLTKKHVEPTAFEKMNVRRAKEIFSPCVIAAIRTLKENASSHPEAHKFKDSDATLTFMILAIHIIMWKVEIMISNSSSLWMIIV